MITKTNAAFPLKIFVVKVFTAKQRRPANNHVGNIFVKNKESVLILTTLGK